MKRLLFLLPFLMIFIIGTGSVLAATPPTYLYNGKFNSFAAAFATANDTPKIALAPSLDLLAVPSISHICLSIYSCSKTETPINS